MELHLQLRKLGMDYEEAAINRDYETAAKIEKQIEEIAEQNPEVWIAPLVVKGRNQVRRRYGLLPVNP